MGAITKLFWQICLLIDGVAYWLLKTLLKIFYSLSTVSIFDAETISGLYNRVWVFIGIVVLMKLAISLVNYMVNPDDFGADKKGFGSLVTRVMISLVLLSSCRLIFQQMYRFQYIITSSHMVETAIFGYNPYQDGANSDTDSISNSIVLSIYSGFFQHQNSDKKEDIDKKILNQKFTDLADYSADKQVNYILIISFVAGFFVDYLLLIFCFDIAIRSIKLGLYEALAPIPIILYIDPKTGDEKLQKYLKAVGSTFLDLFIRIGIINFIIFVVSLLQTPKLSTISANGKIVTGDKDTDITLLAFIILGLFMFAKQMPDLIKDLTGVDLSKSGNMFDLKGKMKGTIPGAVAGFVAGKTIKEPYDRHKAAANKYRQEIANDNYKNHRNLSWAEAREARKDRPHSGAYKNAAAIISAPGNAIKRYNEKKQQAAIDKDHEIANAQNAAMDREAKRIAEAKKREAEERQRAASNAAYEEYTKDVLRGNINPATGVTTMADKNKAMDEAININNQMNRNNFTQSINDREFNKSIYEENKKADINSPETLNSAFKYAQSQQKVQNAAKSVTINNSGPVSNGNNSGSTGNSGNSSSGSSSN